MAVLGLGLAALGRPGYMTVHHALDVVDASEAGLRAQAFAVLDAAWAAGVRHVDVARSYGLGEAFLSAWAHARAPQGLFVSSKWGYHYTGGWARDARVHEVKALTLAQLERQWPESRALLAPWLRVYQAHSVTLESGLLEDSAMLDRLERLRDEGVTPGLSVTGARQPEIIARALALQRHGHRLFGWVQATWNVLEPSTSAALADAHAAGVRVIVKEPLANGRLTDRGDVPALTARAHALGVSTDVLALAAALQQPFVDVVLSGAATVAQLESNLRAQGASLPLDGLEALAQRPADYWAERAQLRWS
jgi:aryl-alcohol dehydrogenase-like predicted oxidoreductase